MKFILNENYVTEEDFCNIYKDEYKEDTSSYYTKREWVKACLYCNALSIKEGLEPCYENLDPKAKDSKGVITHYENNGYRLPTTEEARIDLAKDNFNEKFLEEAEWCDNLALNTENCRGTVKLSKNSSWEDRELITDFSDDDMKLPFRIGRVYDEGEILVSNMPEEGMGQMIFQKDKMGVFVLYNGEYALCYKGLGILKNYGKKLPDAVYEFLIEEGFTKVI